MEARYELLKKDNSRLQIIKVVKKDFDKSRDEIRYHGKLYDVASYRLCQDTVFVTVLHDEAEELITSIISDHFAAGNATVNVSDPHIKSKPHHTPNDVKTLCEKITISPCHFPGLKTSYLQDHIANDLNRSNDIEIPPPQV